MPSAYCPGPGPFNLRVVPLPSVTLAPLRWYDGHDGTLLRGFLQSGELGSLRVTVSFFRDDFISVV
jgi:hypothetical protein